MQSDRHLIVCVCAVCVCFTVSKSAGRWVVGCGGQQTQLMLMKCKLSFISRVGGGGHLALSPSATAIATVKASRNRGNLQL